MLTLTKKNLARLEASAGRAATMLKALSNERRLMVLCQLGACELSVGALQDRLELSQSALSQHLAILREEGIVATRRDGQTIYYRVADPAAVKIVETLSSIYCPET